MLINFTILYNNRIYNTFNKNTKKNTQTMSSETPVSTELKNYSFRVKASDIPKAKGESSSDNEVHITLGYFRGITEGEKDRLEELSKDFIQVLAQGDGPYIRTHDKSRMTPWGDNSLELSGEIDAFKKAWEDHIEKNAGRLAGKRRTHVDVSGVFTHPIYDEFDMKTAYFKEDKNQPKGQSKDGGKKPEITYYTLNAGDQNEQFVICIIINMTPAQKEEFETFYNTFVRENIPRNAEGKHMVACAKGAMMRNSVNITGDAADYWHRFKAQLNVYVDEKGLTLDERKSPYVDVGGDANRALYTALDFGQLCINTQIKGHGRHRRRFDKN